MSSIGPQIPAHLLNPSQDDTSDSEDDNGPASNIGPQIPAHLLNRQEESKLNVYDDDDDAGPQPNIGPSIGPSIPASSIGPSIPAHLRSSSSSRPVAGPSLPSSSSSQKSRPVEAKRTLGTSLPTYAPTYNPNAYADFDEDDEDDDDIGPKPLPAGMVHEQPDAVKEFIEREEKRRKAAEVRIWMIYSTVADPTTGCIQTKSSET